MTFYVLSPADHQTLRQAYTSVRNMMAERRDLLERTGTLDAEALEGLHQDEAFAERVKELIDHLASGFATEKDAKHFCAIMSLKVAEIRRKTKDEWARVAIIRGINALHELGTNGEPVTLN